MVSDVANPTIVHEDGFNRIIFRPAASPFLLVTFGDLTMPADGTRFCADGPAAKLGLSCLGIMPKWPHWYPADSMRQAQAAIAPILARYEERITYGGSMGGHAAIKHSRAVGAAAALALCPQWSLDEQECGFRPGWSEHLGPHNLRMGIKAGDVAGRLYVFSDPLERRDTRHADRIAEAAPGTRRIAVLWAGHHVTRVLAGSDNLRIMIEAARKDDVGRLVQLASRARRESEDRMKRVLLAAHARHPALAMRVATARASVSRKARLLVEGWGKADRN